VYKWPIEEQCGYHPITTFWEDFSIADAFGTSAVKDTYKRAFDNWKTDYKYLTELVMVLNWKIWQWYERNPALGELYNELWQKADEWACTNLTGEALNYFYETTD